MAKKQKYKVGDVIKVDDPVLQSTIRDTELALIGIDSQLEHLARFSGRLQRELWDGIFKAYPGLDRYTSRISYKAFEVEIRGEKGK